MNESIFNRVNMLIYFGKLEIIADEQGTVVKKLSQEYFVLGSF